MSSTLSPPAEMLSNTGKRVRTSKPKVRSGCITCKARRIKCDEIKPSCNRCTKFGRECGGYKHHLTYEERVASRNKQSLLPKLDKMPQPKPIIPTPSPRALSLGLTPPQLFCVEASLELCRVLELPQWTATNLQICKQYPFVRHAFSSIRMLSKRPSASDDYDPASALLAAIDPQLQAHDQSFATLHHGCFLEGARGVLPNGFSDPSQTRLATVVCLLTICLETLQFHHEPALSHLQIGLTLMNQLLGSPSSTSDLYPTDPFFSDINLDVNFIHEMMNVFKMLEAKASELDRCFSLYAPMPLGFTSPFINPFVCQPIFTSTEMIPSYDPTDFSSPTHDITPYGSRDSSVSSQ